MNIAFVTNNYNPITSGITTSINSFVHSLRELGHAVYVIAPSFPGYQDSDPNIVRTSSLALYHKTKYPISITRSRFIANILNDLSINLVHSQHPFGIGATALRAANKQGIPIVFTYHTKYEDYSHYLPLPNGRYLKKAIKTRAIDYANRVNLVICPSRHMKIDIQNSGCVSRIEILPSPISRHLTKREHEFDRTTTLKRFNIPDNASILLCVTRLAIEKNIEFLLRSYAELLLHNKDSRLIIAGDGPTKRALVSLARRLKIAQNVVFVGTLPHSELSYLYSISSVLLFCSTTETQGLPITEAIKFNLPVVAVESNAANELIKDNNFGITAKHVEREFAIAIMQILTNRDIRSQIKQRSLSLLKTFSEHDLARRLESLYEDTINNISCSSHSTIGM